MVIMAAGLLVLGGFTALMGLKLFKVLLPIVGFIAGLMIGYSGTQAVLGVNAFSLSVGLVVALAVGVLLSALSLLYYRVAATLLAMWVGSAAFTYLGMTLGLQDSGFVLLLLAIAGAAVGLMVGSTSKWSTELMMALTSMVGVLFVFAGVLLLVGDLSVDDLHDNGVIASVLDNIDQSFLWLFAWLGGSLMAISVQRRTLQAEVFGGATQFVPTKSRRS